MSEKHATLKISGLKDDHAAETVLSALSAVPGATFADLSVADGVANVEFDEFQATIDDFVAAVEAAGFGAEQG